MDEELTPNEEYFLELHKWVKESFGITLRKASFAVDDWTLVVKLHALIETALNTSLVKHLQVPELAKIIGKLDTSNPATGKVGFAKALGILPSDLAAFIQKLSELRNFCVHDIRNFGFDLNSYVAGLEPTKRNALLKVINAQVLPEAHGVAIQLKLMTCTMVVMMAMQNHDLSCQTRDLKARLQELKARKFDEI